LYSSLGASGPEALEPNYCILIVFLV